jgi:GNAT superfamily N-acetyltransferase
MNGAVTPAELDSIERFYHERGVACTIDLCTLADPAFVALVHQRPYRATEFNNVLARPVLPADAHFDSPGIRHAAPHELADWTRLVAAGFADADQLPDHVELADFASAHCTFAELDGRPAAGAAHSLRDGIAWMFGDATLPSARGRGLQANLIRWRLAHSARAGCDLAVAAVLPGSPSHRNYLRAGFSLLYARIGVTRDLQEVRP